MIQSLKNKPQAGDPPHTANAPQSYFGPGSDIANDHPDITVATINNTHHLIINKFPVFRPMLLLLTVDSYRRQHEPLDLDDLQAAWGVISALREEHYVFFNCTTTAGSSREHKHLQVIPAPGASDEYPEEFKFFPDYEESQNGGPSFTHFLQRIDTLPDGDIKDGEILFNTYIQLLQRARAALDIDSNDGVCPHNFILTKRWMMVVPRCTDKFHDITANAAGMVGSVFLWRQDQLEAWKEIGPMNVLAGLGLPGQGCQI